MSSLTRYDASVTFLANLDDDWARLITLVGPCRHDPKAAREPYEALVRAIAYQQLTAKAGDANIGRLKALFEGREFPRPEDLIAVDFEAMRTCGFSASKIATIKAIAKAAVSGVIPTREVAVAIDDDALIERMVTIKGIGPDRRDAADVLPGTYGHSAGRRSRCSRGLPRSEIASRKAKAQRAAQDSGSLGAPPDRRGLVSLAHTA